MEFVVLLKNLLKGVPMAGYNLKEESYIQKQLTEDDLWSIISGMFSKRFLTIPVISLASLNQF